MEGTPLMKEWSPSCLRNFPRIITCTPVLSPLIICSFTARNYDICNQELRQSRWPWRSGDTVWRRAEKPFLVWIERKNLEYSNKEKHLNARQARWALFFSCFNFTLSYSQESRNMQLDALSHKFTKKGNTPNLTPFCLAIVLLPLSNIVEQYVIGTVHQHPLFLPATWCSMSIG